MRWDLYEKCVKWAGVLFDEDARRDVALQTLEEIGDRELTEKEIKHRVKWRALNRLKADSKHTTFGGDALMDPRAQEQLATDANRVTSPEESLDEKRLRQQLCDAIGAEQVEFLEKCTELSSVEMAHRFGLTPAAVGMRRARLRRKAREIL